MDKMHNYICDVLLYIGLAEAGNTLCDAVSSAQAEIIELDKKNNCKSMWLIYTLQITWKANRI